VTYEVALKRAAAKELDDVAEPHRQRIRDAIEELRANPRHEGSIRLHGGENGYRIRVGDYRVMYTVDDASRTVRIYKIGHRREIYR